MPFLFLYSCIETYLLHCLYMCPPMHSAVFCPPLLRGKWGSHHSCTCICAHLIYCFARRCCYEDLIYCCICVQLCCKEAQCSTIFVPSLLLRSPHFLLYLCPPLLLGSLHLLIHSCPPLFLRKASVIDLFVPTFVC